VNNWNIEKAQDMKYSIWRAKFKILRKLWRVERQMQRGKHNIFFANMNT
jgi:hypothetical protein